MVRTYRTIVRAARSVRDEFVSRYKTRIVEGLPKYGVFDPSTDPRVLCEEATEEFLDGGGSYMEMLEQKWPVMRDDAMEITRLSIIIYSKLQKMKVKELALMAERARTN